MRCEASSHIDILIVGAGLAGLYAAIECHRQGHLVRVLESKSGLDEFGLTLSSLDTEMERSDRP